MSSGHRKDKSAPDLKSTEQRRAGSEQKLRSHTSSSVCQRCGACCSAVVDGELVACRHLDTAGGRYRCHIYATRPAVCRDFDCLRTGEPSPSIAERVAAALATA